jgi:hypothetical protein
MARSLPQLGRRGEGWVALQIVLLAVIIATGIMGPAWPSSVRTWLAIAAGLLALVGLYLFLGGKHPEYDEYRRSVRAAFVPFVW